MFWVIAATLVVMAAALLFQSNGSVPGSLAFGQPTLSGGSRGVFAFSGQLAKGRYGVYMVDVDAMTTWVYEYLPQKGCLRLAAARTWRYDRYLENYNVCDLPPSAVEQMLEEQRRNRRQADEAEQP